MLHDNERKLTMLTMVGVHGWLQLTVQLYRGPCTMVVMVKTHDFNMHAL